MSVLYQAGDNPRVVVEGDLDAALGMDNALMVRLIENEFEHARITAFTDDGAGETRHILIRVSATDLMDFAFAATKIADEMGKRAAEAR